MENASKAIIMAGGILIGIIIVTIFVYEMTSMSTTAKQYDAEMARTQVLDFNSKIEVYFGESYIGNTHIGTRELTAQEVATLYSYVYEWNYGGEGHPSDIVELHLTGEGSLGIDSLSRFSIVNGTFTKLPIETFLNQFSRIIQGDEGTRGERLKGQTDYYFRCANPIYREGDGRICSFTVQSVKRQ
ncbi:MAG: hypothetical protein HFJ54_02475 [Clostridia bacterium]|nr:hypothetical protein [Clostridia bacterium]